MTAYDDLEECDYYSHPHWASCLRAVGWLGHGTPFAQGVVAPDVRAALGRLVETRWSFFAYMDYHVCELCCGRLEPPLEMARALVAAGAVPATPRPWGSGDVFIPGPGYVFAVPEMILHYIDVHHYAPPRVFQDAVLACPPMSSRAYFRRLRHSANGAFAHEIPRAWWELW